MIPSKDEAMTLINEAYDMNPVSSIGEQDVSDRDRQRIIN